MTNKQCIDGMIDLLNQILKTPIKDIKYDSIKRFRHISEYGFSLVKIKAKTLEDKIIDIYLRFIKKGKIRESIFCYWCMLYEEELEFKENTSIMTNKVSISEISSNLYENSVLLEIEENKSEILRNGAKLHFLDIANYLKSKKQIEKWKQYISDEFQDLLLVGFGLDKNSEY